MRTLTLVAVLLLLGACTTTNHYNTQLFESDWLDTNPGAGSTPAQPAGGGFTDAQKEILETVLKDVPSALDTIEKEMAVAKDVTTSGTASPATGPKTATQSGHGPAIVFITQSSGSEAKTDAQVDTALRLAAAMNSPNANPDASGDDDKPDVPK